MVYLHLQKQSCDLGDKLGLVRTDFLLLLGYSSLISPGATCLDYVFLIPFSSKVSTVLQFRTLA